MHVCNGYGININMSISLEAREILNHLNSLGFRNITADQLKEFMKDLKRLIKYESRYSHNAAPAVYKDVQSSSSRHQQHTADPPNAIEKRQPILTAATSTKNTNPSTIIRVSDPDQLPRVSANKENRPIAVCECPKQPHTRTVANKNRRPVDMAELTNRPELTPVLPPETKSVGTSTKTRSTAGVQQIVRNTPTDLYQFYQKDWKRFKQHIPGENSRALVRSEIHKKMEHKPPPNPKVYLTMNDDQTKEICRSWNQ